MEKVNNSLTKQSCVHFICYDTSGRTQKGREIWNTDHKIIRIILVGGMDTVCIRWHVTLPHKSYAYWSFLGVGEPYYLQSSKILKGLCKGNTRSPILFLPQHSINFLQYHIKNILLCHSNAIAQGLILLILH